MTRVYKIVDFHRWVKIDSSCIVNDVEGNLVCSCRECNRSKKDKTPEEWGGAKLWQDQQNKV